MVADPFEVEHNTTGQISDKNLERMNKTWKRILFRSKMKKFTGQSTRKLIYDKNYIMLNIKNDATIDLDNTHCYLFSTLIKIMLMH